MNPARTITALFFFLATVVCTLAQDAPTTEASAPVLESNYKFHYSLSVIDDATIYSDLVPPIPAFLAQKLNNPSFTLFQNQLLIEPSFSLHYQNRWTLAASAAELAASYHGLNAADFGVAPGAPIPNPALAAELNDFTGTHVTLHMKEAYAGLSAGDFDFTLGRRMVRWSTGYAFTPAGVLDPPRTPTNPNDRLSLNQGRDMTKADFVHGPHAMQLAWSSAALAPAGSNLHDTTAFRYNIMLRGFDTSLIAAYDHGGDGPIGALTFTRVLGQAWEIHGEGVYRQQGALLLGAKYTTSNGITFIGEFYTPPNIATYRSTTLSPTAGRQHYALFNAGKSRLRELPEWKQWDLSASIVANFDDQSRTAVFDVTRRFGNHFSSYLHMELPQGDKTSEYGSAPYSAATSAGVRFQL